jgi:hypothetical protein
MRQFDEQLTAQNQEKYTVQVGLRDVDFDIDPRRQQLFGFCFPVLTIPLAEQALTQRILIPTRYMEYDNTEHNVLIFDPRPVGYSGFMNCVTHSITMTNHGLFEVGRYPAMKVDGGNRHWQWFFHRRLATVDNVNEWCEDRAQSMEDFMRDAYQAMTGQ